MKKLTAIVLSLVLLASVIYPAYAEDGSPKIEVPQIRITTQNGNGTSLQKADGYIGATVSVTDTDSSNFTENASVKVRGNSTAFESIAKKSYTFKFGKKKNVLNMGSGKKWALVSNIYDPTLARNYTAFSLAQELGIQYTSNFKVVEVWMDNSFRGCYLLFEPVDKGKDRVNIDVDENEFMLELEALREEDDVKYIKSNGIRFAVSEPDPPSDEQLSYIQSTMDDVISTIRNGSKEEIESKIDIESFVKFYLLNEFLKTVDFDFSSVFYYYKDGKLYAGPPWDYDLSSGNVNKDFSARYASSYKTDGLFISNYNLYKWLCDKEWFYDLAKAEFTEHYSYFAGIPAEGGVIDSFYNTYKNVINRNFNDAGWQVNRYYVNVMKYPLATFAENWDFYVNWCKERVDWMTEYFEVDPSAIQTTEEPTTSAPTTQQPTTEAPTTEAPTTEASATEAPTTEAPATETSATEQPTTSQEPTETTSEPIVTEPAPTTDPYPTDPEPDIFLGELNDGYSLYYNNLPPPPWMNEFGYQYGKYIFTSFNSSDEEGHGVYVRKGYEKLMLSEAFKKGITDIDEVVSLIYKSDLTYLKNRIINTDDAEKLVKERYNREVYLDYIGIIYAGYYLFYDNPMKPENKGGRALCEWEQEFIFGKYHFLEYAGHTGNVEPEDLGLYVLNDGKILNIEEALNRIPESVFANDLVELINSKDLLYSFKITYVDSEYDETVPNTESTESTTSSYELPTDNPTTPATEATKPEKPIEYKPIVLNNDISLKAGETKTLNTSIISSFKSSNPKVASVKNGTITALKKGTAEIKETFDKITFIYKVKVTSSPKLNKTSLSVKKGKTKTIKIIGKAKAVNNKYKNTKKAKIVSKKSSSNIKIRGLKKGKTTLYVFVNGVKLKLKVKVK